MPYLKNSLSLETKGCAPVFITMKEPFYILLNSSAVINGLSVIWRDCDGSFLLRDTEPVITVRVPSALEIISAVARLQW